MGIDLAIDTAGDDASLALLDGDRVVAERAWHIETNVTQELLGALDALFVEAGVARDAVARIAVDVGPGGYSGLRSGVAAAQGIALALGVPLAGVSRLEADAYPHLLARPRGTPVVAAHDAGRSGIAWAAYTLPPAPEALEAEGRSAPPDALVAARLDPAVDAVAAAPAGAPWCGEASDELRAALADRAARDAEPGNGDTVPRLEARAVTIVRLARLHDAFGDPALVDVVYLRPPSITKPKR